MKPKDFMLAGLRGGQIRFPWRKHRSIKKVINPGDYREIELRPGNRKFYITPCLFCKKLFFISIDWLDLGERYCISPCGHGQYISPDGILTDIWSLKSNRQLFPVDMFQNA